MRNNSSKETSDNQPLARTAVGFMFKEYGPSFWKLFFSRWTHITQDDLKFHWPRWGPFDIPKFIYLYAQSYKSKQNGGNLILIGTWRAQKETLKRLLPWVANSDLSERLSKLEKLAKASPIPFVGVLKLYKCLGFLSTYDCFSISPHLIPIGTHSGTPSVPSHPFSSYSFIGSRFSWSPLGTQFPS